MRRQLLCYWAIAKRPAVQSNESAQGRANRRVLLHRVSCHRQLIARLSSQIAIAGLYSAEVLAELGRLLEAASQKFGKRIYLAQLLEEMDSFEHQLDWGRAKDEKSLYEKFKILNPHIDLPNKSEEEIVPEKGNVLLTTRSSRRPVRFFLTPRCLAWQFRRSRRASTQRYTEWLA